MYCDEARRLRGIDVPGQRLRVGEARNRCAKQRACKDECETYGVHNACKRLRLMNVPSQFGCVRLNTTPRNLSVSASSNANGNATEVVTPIGNTPPPAFRS